MEGLAQIAKPGERFSQDSIRQTITPDRSDLMFKFECRSEDLAKKLDEEGLIDPYEYFKTNEFNSIIIWIDGSGYFGIHRTPDSPILELEITNDAKSKYEKIIKSYNKLIENNGLTVKQIRPNVRTLKDISSGLSEAYNNLESQDVAVVGEVSNQLKELSEELASVTESVEYI